MTDQIRLASALPDGSLRDNGAFGARQLDLSRAGTSIVFVGDEDEQCPTDSNSKDDIVLAHVPLP